MAKYSVVLTTHKRPNSLARTISSVKTQSYPDLSLVVISDTLCSETRGVVVNRMSAGDLFVERVGHNGPAASRNVGLKCASSQYVIFLDDDDELNSDYIESADRIIDDRENRIFFSDRSLYNYSERKGTVDEVPFSKTATGNCDPDDIYIKNFIANSCAIYPTKIIQNRMFDETLILNEDWDFLLSVLQAAPLEYLPYTGPHGPVRYGVNVEQENRGWEHNDQLLDVYIKVYKKWPAPSKKLRLARQQLLARAGVMLPLELF